MQHKRFRNGSPTTRDQTAVKDIIEPNLISKELYVFPHHEYLSEYFSSGKSLVFLYRVLKFLSQIFEMRFEVCFWLGFLSLPFFPSALSSSKAPATRNRKPQVFCFTHFANGANVLSETLLYEFLDLTSGTFRSIWLTVHGAITGRLTITVNDTAKKLF